jgi:cell division protease FtsH
MGQNPPPAPPAAKPAAPPSGPSPQKPPDMLAPLRTRRFWIVLGILLLLNIVVGQVFSGLGQTPTVTISYNTFLTQVTEGNVTSVTSTGESINGITKKPVADFQSGTTSTKFQTQRPAFANDDLLTLLQNSNVVINAKDPNAATPLWETLLFSFGPTILLVLGFLYLSRRAASAGAGGILGSFGQSRARLYDAERPAVTFDDVAGIDEVKADLQEIVDFLREPQKYTRLGGAAPKGVLLIGAPGTGKTLLARAVAGEAKVPFFSISGSEFVEAIVGVGASRVRDLFAKARAAAPAIIFIDEIDALGRARGAYGIGGHDEKEQTLNQLLAELDGFDPKSGLVLIGATNRPEVLDPALLRAGRFDRTVVVDRPDRSGRVQILRVHAKKVTLAQGVDLDQVAALTPGFSGADLANLVNEAALQATRSNHQQVELDDFTVAIERIVAGLEKRSRVLSASERTVVAHHEMGHALVATALPGQDPVQKVSIIPRGIGALGYTLQRPIEDRYLMSRTELENKMATLLGGRAAEHLVFGELSTGAADDLAKATQIARSMVARYGMDPTLGPVVYEQERAAFLATDGISTTQRSYSEQTAREIDVAARNLVEAAFTKSVKILTERRNALERGAQRLLQKETLADPELKELLAAP